MTGVPLLEANGVSKNFGGLSALDGVNLSLESGKLHAIIGPNGAGKTTFFNVITGTLPVSAGRIKFLGDDITDKAVHQISHRGLARTLQIKSVFGNMTVRENLWIAAQSRDGVFSVFKNWKKCDRATEKAVARAARRSSTRQLGHGATTRRAPPSPRIARRTPPS